MDKLVASLTKKSLNGPTPLDSKWKELMDQQEVSEAGDQAGRGCGTSAAPTQNSIRRQSMNMIFWSFIRPSN